MRLKPPNPHRGPNFIGGCPRTGLGPTFDAG
jgi:hypothetical protein